MSILKVLGSFVTEAKLLLINWNDTICSSSNEREQVSYSFVKNNYEQTRNKHIHVFYIYARIRVYYNALFTPVYEI
jgi:hypothetical protein